jgi:ATP-binding cassette, subfamily B, bacterial
VRAILRILKQARNLWPYYAAITVFSVLFALTTQVSPFIVKAVAEQVTNALAHHTQPNYLLGIWLAVALFASDVAGTLFSNIGGYYGDIMAEKLKKSLSERYYEQLLSLPQSYFDAELTGKIISRLNRTIAELTNFLNFFANNFFQMILSMVFTLVVVAYFSWEVAVLLFIIYPLFIWLTTLTSRDWQEYQRQKNQNVDIAGGRFAEAVSQLKVVKSFIQERHELRHLQHHYQQTVDITYKQSRQWHKMDIVRRLVLSVIFFLIVGFIFWQTLTGRFTVGEMFLLVQFSAMMRLPLFSMSFIVDQTQKAIAGSKDYFAVMSLKPAIADRPGAEALKVKQGKVEYKHVAFSYNGKEQVFNDVTFAVKTGSKLALVGESGEGKTTLTNLLLRFYEPQAGEILIDGQNIVDVTQKSLREQIAVVFQEPALFSGTVRENIAYARPDATHRAITDAAKAANAHEFTKKLPSGYDTEIGERGVRLSGGQKQRIAIARALLKNAPILILDEATSSLDSKAEAQVQEALENLMRGRTTLIIAHRLSTIAHVDTIVTLRNGKVDETGPPSKLAKTKGIYAELLQLQMGATEAAKKRLKEFELVGES